MASRSYSHIPCFPLCTSAANSIAIFHKQSDTIAQLASYSNVTAPLIDQLQKQNAELQTRVAQFATSSNAIGTSRVSYSIPPLVDLKADHPLSIPPLVDLVISGVSS